MKVKLSEIKSASKRVRQSWDVEKMAELVLSIKEQGLLVPVKLRPNGKGYDVVFGHRRIGAAREAGLTEIEAMVEGVDDDTAYIQALTENVVREDMSSYEIALALKAIKDATGYTDERIGAMFGWGGKTINNYLQMLPFKEILTGQNLGVKHVKEARAGTTSDKDAAAVLKKAANGELSTRKTRQVAEIVTRAREFGGQKAVDRMLKQEADEILRAAKPFEECKRPQPATATKVTGEILFQWIKDTRVILAEEAIGAISECVSAIARSKEDKGGGKTALKMLRKRVQIVLNQIDEVLNAYS